MINPIDLHDYHEYLNFAEIAPAIEVTGPTAENHSVENRVVESQVTEIDVPRVDVLDGFDVLIREAREAGWSKRVRVLSASR